MTARNDSPLAQFPTDASEKASATQLAAPDAPLPIHFFTIVLNGKPFIEHHVDQFRKLPFEWHWHVVEGVAALHHDTGWSVANGGKIPVELQHNGLSIDGTTAYLDQLATKFPKHVTLYCKPNQMWDGKREMVSAPLTRIDADCLLWQIDADELWTADQIVNARELFMQHPEKTAALYRCHFFVGPNLVTTTRGTYANSASEWLRTWRFRPGMQWAAHEPPVLAQQQSNGQWVDVAAIDCFTQDETESAGLVFEHYAYATLPQVRFKEAYYGYQGAVERWAALQYHKNLPTNLGNYFPWVQDNTTVDRADKVVPNRLARLTLTSPPWSVDASGLPRIIVDGVFFQRYTTGISRVWWSILSEWVRNGFAKQVLVIDRAGTFPRIEGIRTRIAPAHDYQNLQRDRALVQEICDAERANVFISTYYSTPLATPSVLMVHDMTAEAMGADPRLDMWHEKAVALDHASAFICVSHATKQDLKRFRPEIPDEKVTVAHNGIWPVFAPTNEAQIQQFRQRHHITRPYFLHVGARATYKNGRMVFEAFRRLSDPERFQIVCVGGEEMNPELIHMVPPPTLVVLRDISDDELAVAYSGALALVYPSKYEGFGLPVLEAMACGCPVIAARLTAVPEVAGEAALYADPDDPDAVAAAMQQTLDPSVRRRLIASGRQQAKKFRWDDMALAVQQVLSRIAAQAPK